MHILLTDLLHCPRCGPGHGLILLANRLEERRVLDGWLGCSNCREHYPLVEGSLDLRVGVGILQDRKNLVEREEGAAWLAALMGLAGAEGTVAIVGEGAELAPAVAFLVPDVEIVALTGSLVLGPEPAGVSRVASGPTLPFRTGTLRALALTGGANVPWQDALRVVQPGGRLVVDGAAPELAEAIRGAGVDVLVDQDGVLVARAPATPVEMPRKTSATPHDVYWGDMR